MLVVFLNLAIDVGIQGFAQVKLEDLTESRFEITTVLHLAFELGEDWNVSILRQ